jgi:acetaldehyde dehydrogenase
VRYAEIVATVASVSAGPGTRDNIDEFTRTTAGGVERLGGAERGKAIIILNPADPPMMMQNTIFCAVADDIDADAVAASVTEIADAIRAYVPGYRLRQRPQFEPSTPERPARVVVFVEVQGAGDYLPPYAGNLDIMTASATKVGEEIAKHITRKVAT